MRNWLLLLGLASFGCSTSPAPGDAGSDAAETPDSVVVQDGAACSLPEYDSGGVTPECIVSASFTCGVDVYEVDCECPTSTCSCFKNGTKLKTLGYAGCPTCVATSFDDGGCGFPVSVAH